MWQYSRNLTVTKVVIIKSVPMVEIVLTKTFFAMDWSTAISGLKIVNLQRLHFKRLNLLLSIGNLHKEKL